MSVWQPDGGRQPGDRKVLVRRITSLTAQLGWWLVPFPERTCQALAFFATRPTIRSLQQPALAAAPQALPRQRPDRHRLLCAGGNLCRILLRLATAPARRPNPT